MVRSVQFSQFSYEVKKLTRNKEINHSKIRNLLPILDEDKILRVGGRLQNANLSDDTKHPKLNLPNLGLLKLLMCIFI